MNPCLSVTRDCDGAVTRMKENTNRLINSWVDAVFIVNYIATGLPIFPFNELLEPKYQEVQKLLYKWWIDAGAPWTELVPADHNVKPKPNSGQDSRGRFRWWKGRKLYY